MFYFYSRKNFVLKDEIMLSIYWKFRTRKEWYFKKNKKAFTWIEIYEKKIRASYIQVSIDFGEKEEEEFPKVILKRKDDEYNLYKLENELLSSGYDQNSINIEETVGYWVKKCRKFY